jgi:sugar phosphate isomerase/epimerase
MAIKRGVSLYSYQQEEWFGRWTWRDQLKEVALNLDGADGVELINEATIPHYPYPDEAFIDEFNTEMARWGLKGTALNTSPDSLQYRRDHVMNDAELAVRLRRDIKLAHALGIENVKILGNTVECVSMALPLAEELNVRITQEIHFPSPIKRDPNSDRYNKIMDILEYVEKTGTKHYGFQPDLGVFRTSPSDVYLGYYFRMAGYEDYEPHVKAVMEAFKSLSYEDLVEWAKKTYPKVFNGGWADGELRPASAAPEELKLIAPYIYCVHGKFFHMVELPDRPGEYTDLAVDTEGVIKVLKEIGYEGYIDSEYEGQRSQQDRGEAYLANEVEEVRKHQKMLKRLIEEA